jgi:NADH-quinone oxidoreductase subunit A
VYGLREEGALLATSSGLRPAALAGGATGGYQASGKLPVGTPLCRAKTMDAWVNDLLPKYLPVLIFLGLAIVISLICIGGSWLVARQKPDTEKAAAYECGFDAFGDARAKFDVRFYLVAILFIIFDLEVAFLFPWAVSLGKLGLFGFWSMVVFLGVLTIGFIYEWRKGALEWE